MAIQQMFLGIPSASAAGGSSGGCHAQPPRRCPRRVHSGRRLLPPGEIDKDRER